ncbi:response regulator [Treponema sp. HNW]|uniref:response regulator transcription factor n=1 Tax=Treponema sp. HNW TaxID=3116654 RepID=UPI003D1467AA
MYRVLLVDDEPIVLEGMRIFPWDKENCVPVGEALDGITGLEMVQSLSPDIIFTDIRMPGLDGLEFADKVHRLKPETIILILTGHSEFSYAQKALHIGVFDFLLKPISFDTLHTTLKRVCTVLNKRQQEQQYTEQLSAKLRQILPIVHEQILIDNLQRKFDPQKHNISLDSFCKELFVIAVIRGDNIKTLEAYVLKDILSEKIKNIDKSCIILSELEQHIVLFRFPYEKDRSDCQKKVKKILEDIQLYVWKKYKISFSAGISLANDDFFRLAFLKQQALEILQKNQLIKKNSISVFEYGTISSLASSKIEHAKNQLCAALLTRREKIICEAFDKMTSIIQTNIDDTIQIRNTLYNIRLEIFSLVNKKDTYISTDNLSDKNIQEYISAMKEEILTLLYSLQNQDLNTQKEVEIVVSNYIKEHYAENISLTTLSETLCYSTAYLSRLIKKHCKQNFMTMLTNKRLEKAKELLIADTESIACIAQKVGYNNTGYFITAFNKHVGCTPADYRLSNSKI